MIIRSKEDIPSVEGRPWFDDASIFKCFHCLNNLTYPFALWHGTEPICFHPACFLDWLPRIMRDIWEIAPDLRPEPDKNE